MPDVTPGREIARLVLYADQGPKRWGSSCVGCQWVGLDWASRRDAERERDSHNSERHGDTVAAAWRLRGRVVGRWELAFRPCFCRQAIVAEGECPVAGCDGNGLAVSDARSASGRTSEGGASSPGS